MAENGEAMRNSSQERPRSKLCAAVGIEESKEAMVTPGDAAAADWDDGSFGAYSQWEFFIDFHFVHFFI
jgi:hypothetical protein